MLRVSHQLLTAPGLRRSEFEYSHTIDRLAMFVVACLCRENMDDVSQVVARSKMKFTVLTDRLNPTKRGDNHHHCMGVVSVSLSTALAASESVLPVGLSGRWQHGCWLFDVATTRMRMRMRSESGVRASESLFLWQYLPST